MFAGDDQFVLQSRVRAIMTARIGWAQALEATVDVDTSASVVARVQFALVDVDAAQLARKSTTLANGGR